MGCITGEIAIGADCQKPASTSAPSVRDQFCNAETPRAKAVVEKIGKADEIVFQQGNHSLNAKSRSKLDQRFRENFPNFKTEKRAPQGYTETPSGTGEIAIGRGCQNPASTSIVPRPTVLNSPENSEVYQMDEIELRTKEETELRIATQKAEQEEKKASTKEEFERIKERLDFKYGLYKQAKAKHDALLDEHQKYTDRLAACNASYGGHYAHTAECTVELPKMRNLQVTGNRDRRQAFIDKTHARQGVETELTRLCQPDMVEFGGCSHWRELYPLGRGN